MKIWCIALVLALAASAAAMPIATSARSMVPAEVQQIISVDYRAQKDSPTAQALKQQVLPENLKQFEEALKGMGIDSEHDVDQLTFASGDIFTPKAARDSRRNRSRRHNARAILAGTSLACC